MLLCLHSVCFCRLALPAAGSAAITFGHITGAVAAAAPAGEQLWQCAAVLALLNGTLLCVAAASTCTNGIQDTAQQHQQQQQQLVSLSVLWQYKCSAPIFSSPVISQQQGLVITAAVDGVVAAVGLQSGQQMWLVRLEGQQIFADLLLQQLLPAAVPDLVRNTDATAGGVVNVHQQQQQQSLQVIEVDAAGGSRLDGSGGREVALVATKAGQVLGLDVNTGNKVSGGAVITTDRQCSCGGASCGVMLWNAART